MKPVLSLHAVSLGINGTGILSDIGLELYRGQITALAGRSGSGKSMLAASVTGLLPARAILSGTIRFKGKDMDTGDRRIMEKIRGAGISMIFQDTMTTLNPVHTIGAQIAEAAICHRQAGRQQAADMAARLLEQAGLDPDTVSPERYPHELSGGQRQRVAIAMAVITKPDVIIADEPTSALDCVTGVAILNMLRKTVRENGTALLLISHDMKVASCIADRIAILENGMITGTYRPDALRGENGTGMTANPAGARAGNMKTASGNGQKPLLEVRNISCEYTIPRQFIFSGKRKIRAVDDISFKLYRGEHIAVIGESGSGKSTLARAIPGLHMPARGTVTVCGDRLQPRNSVVMRRIRQQVQTVFQDTRSAFNPRHRIGRILAEPFHLSDAPLSGTEKTRHIGEALNAVDLEPGDADKYPHEFSGGQRQRIAIARALITRPGIIILDEATASLDSTTRGRILDLLMHLAQTYGLTYIFITHDPCLVRHIASRVIVMHKGKVIEENDTRSVFTAPCDIRTRKLVTALPGREMADMQSFSFHDGFSGPEDRNDSTGPVPSQYGTA